MAKFSDDVIIAITDAAVQIQKNAFLAELDMQEELWFRHAISGREKVAMSRERWIHYDKYGSRLEDALFHHFFGGI